MKENHLVPIKEKAGPVFNEELCGVIVEKSNRKKKRKRSSKKLVVFLILLCLSIVVIKNFNHIKNLFDKMITPSPTNATSSNEDKTITEDSKNDDVNEPQVTPIEPIDFEFIHTSPTELTYYNNYTGNIDFDELNYHFLSKKEVYEKYGEKAPIVLLVTFSPSECYSNGLGYSYSSKFHNSEDNVENIAAQIYNSLVELGINALHLECEYKEGTLYENKAIYKEQINNILKANPSIQYVFDISRELNFNENMSINSETVCANGVNLPTIHIMCGTKSIKMTETQRKGIFLANELATHFNETIPLFVSKQTISDNELNLNLSVPSIRICIGSYANTFADASLSASYFSLLLADYIEK